MSSKNKWYVALGGAALILILVAVILYAATGDTTAATAPGAAGLAAAAAAAKAYNERQKARETVTGAIADTTAVEDEITENHATAEANMAAIPDSVKALSDEAKVEEGNNLFGGSST